MKYDVIIQNCMVYNSFNQSFVKNDVAIKQGYFARIAENLYDPDAKVMNGMGKYMVPGLVDIHMHIESSMSIPSRFSDAVLPHGTTTVVADPHEIANVFGREGILSFLSQESELDIFFGIPSSVPSTNAKLETTGGVIDVEDVIALLKHPRIVCLGEVMNFHDVCYEENSTSRRIINACKSYRPQMPLEGHCPKISGEQLAEFLAQGISADHTHQSSESVIEKISNGMFLEIQRKSMSQEVIDALIQNHFYEYFCFVTDDVMADSLRCGHLNELVEKAISMGMPAEKAIYCSTFTPARRMHLEDRGAIAPGRIADFILLDDIEHFHICDVYKRGKHVEKKNTRLKESFPASFYHSIMCRKASEDDFLIHQKGNRALCNVMEIEPHSTFTRHRQMWLPITDGNLELGDLALLTVFERYGKHGGVTHGLAANTLKGKGAIATSWAHDHHNVMVLGNDIADMLLAQHALVDMQGGYVVVKDHQVIASVQLEIGGIVSASPIDELGAQLEKVREAMRLLGYQHDNEIMSFSTLSLLVSPELKISDKGMINTRSQQIVPLVEAIE